MRKFRYPILGVISTLVIAFALFGQTFRVPLPGQFGFGSPVTPINLCSEPAFFDERGYLGVVPQTGVAEAAPCGYTDLDALAAIEGEPTLNLAGAVTIAGSLAVAGAFNPTWSPQDFNNQALTNVNIDSGNITGVTVSGDLTWGVGQGMNNQIIGNIGQAGNDLLAGTVTWSSTSNTVGSITMDTWALAAGTNSRLYLARSNNATVNTHTAVDSGDALGSVVFQGSDGAAFQIGAEIFAEATETHGSGPITRGTRFQFWNAPNGAAGEQLNLTLDQDGSLLLERGFLELNEMAAPGAGAANTARVYAIVDGGTLTDLAAVFQDGTVDIFAQEVTEPGDAVVAAPDGALGTVIWVRDHPGSVKLVVRTPGYADFVIMEKEFHSAEKIGWVQGAVGSLPVDWEVETKVDSTARIACTGTWNKVTKFCSPKVVRIPE